MKSVLASILWFTALMMCAAGILALYSFNVVGIQPPKTSAPIQLLIRSDDLGMCHSVNAANLQLIETGIPFSTSVIFAAPWYKETVAILKAHPQISVGVHLCLNAEWKSYRWGSVAGRAAVPSLVNEAGYFRGEVMWNWRDDAKPAEIEAEFRAQIERALASGLKIDYIDNHMGAGLYTLPHRLIVEKLAREYKLGISGYFNEFPNRVQLSRIPYENQLNAIIRGLSNLQPGKPNLMVFHLGLTTAEMNALEDLNPQGTRNMSKQRETELRTLAAPEFRQALKARNIQLITYRDLINNTGIENMLRPERK